MDSSVSEDQVYIEEFDALYIKLRTSATSKYPAKQHARAVVKHLGVKDGLIYLVGTPSQLEEDSDQPVPFKQRRYFFYMSGVDFEDCFLSYDIAKDDLRLYVPATKDPRTVIFMGLTPSVEECEEKYDVDRACLTTDFGDYLDSWLRVEGNNTIYLLHKDQKPTLKGTDSLYQERFGGGEVNWNSTLLHPAMDASRVIKSDFEVDLIRRANTISSRAHRHVLQKLATFTNEAEIEATFGASCVAAGAKKQAYDIIAASGENASTLHYSANNQPLRGRQLVCLDAGAEWDCYASDITRTFPISGTYSIEAKQIYDIVYHMQRACIEQIQPGLVYHDLHVLANRIAVEGLKDLGILQGGTVEEMIPTGRAFFPHGLGHHLGLEVHDVSGKEPLLASSLPSIHSRQPLRSPSTPLPPPDSWTSTPYNGHQKLEANMVLTVEPGVYFSRYALENVYLKDPAHAKYINAELLERYYPVGGIRIEDDILVTAHGYENLTTAPKGEEACEIIRKGWRDSRAARGWKVW